MLKNVKRTIDTYFPESNPGDSRSNPRTIPEHIQNQIRNSRTPGRTIPEAGKQSRKNQEAIQETRSEHQIKISIFDLHTF